MPLDNQGRNRLESLLASIVPRTGDFAVVTSSFAVALHTITYCLQTGSVAQNLGTESKKAERDPQADAGEEGSGRNIPDGTHADSPDLPVELPVGIIVVRTLTRRLNHKKFASNGCSSCQKSLERIRSGWSERGHILKRPLQDTRRHKTKERKAAKLVHETREPSQDQSSSSSRAVELSVLDSVAQHRQENDDKMNQQDAEKSEDNTINMVKQKSDTTLERNITDSAREWDDRPLPTHSKSQTLTCWNIGISSIMIKRAWKRCKKHQFSMCKIWRTSTSRSECHNQSPSHSDGWTLWRARQYTHQDLDKGLLP